MLGSKVASCNQLAARFSPGQVAGALGHWQDSIRRPTGLPFGGLLVLPIVMGDVRRADQNNGTLNRT